MPISRRTYTTHESTYANFEKNLHNTWIIGALAMQARHLTRDPCFETSILT
jgi:hypothetical protein